MPYSLSRRPTHARCSRCLLLIRGSIPALPLCQDFLRLVFFCATQNISFARRCASDSASLNGMTKDTKIFCRRLETKQPVNKGNFIFQLLLMFQTESSGFCHWFHLSFIKWTFLVRHSSGCHQGLTYYFFSSVLSGMKPFPTVRFALNRYRFLSRNRIVEMPNGKHPHDHQPIKIIQSLSLDNPHWHRHRPRATDRKRDEKLGNY